MKLFLSAIIFLAILSSAFPQSAELISNIHHRNVVCLDGKWRIIIDPYEVGYYDYRYEPKNDGYFLDRHPER